jgi:hypothetical protein
MPAARVIVSILVVSLHAFAFAMNPVGRYDLQSRGADGQSVSIVVTIARMDSGKFGGDLTGNAIGAVRILDVTVADSTISFTVQATDEAIATVRMVVSGNSVTGDWTMGTKSIKLTGHRIAASPASPASEANLAGRWSYSAPRGEEPVRSGTLMIVSHPTRGYSGQWTSHAPDADSSNVKIRFEHGTVTVRVPTRSLPDRTGPTDRFVTIVAVRQPDGTLKGRWYRESGASGDWTAARY